MRNDLRQSFEARYPFPLDPFQRDAIDAIADDKSVIVSAPTGSGKTLVAEFAIHAALARRRRIVTLARSCGGVKSRLGCAP